MTKTNLIPLELLLTMIADEMAPEAYFRATKAEGIATALGLILAVFLTSLEYRFC
ncbi:hypothetical protein ACFLV7_15230 [Chloroflexota bacterium]